MPRHWTLTGHIDIERFDEELDLAELVAFAWPVWMEALERLAGETCNNVAPEMLVPPHTDAAGLPRHALVVEA